DIRAPVTHIAVPQTRQGIDISASFLIVYSGALAPDNLQIVIPRCWCERVNQSRKVATQLDPVPYLDRCCDICIDVSTACTLLLVKSSKLCCERDRLRLAKEVYTSHSLLTLPIT